MATHLSSPSTPTSSHRFSNAALSLLALFPSSPATTHPQTFLHSPSPTATSFRIDLPVLPLYPSETTYRNSTIEIESPNRVQQTTFLYSPSEQSFHSPLSRWASIPTAVGGPSPLLTTYRVSDVRAGEMESDVEDEDDDYIAEWDVVPTHALSQLDADTEPLVVTAELELPHIREEDFPYYPETAELPFTDAYEKEEKNDKGRLRHVGRKLCKKTCSKRFSLQDMVKKRLVKMKLRKSA